MTAPRRPVRIGNASGFYGDRAAAMREMVTEGPLDVVTGDYLAELTMLILWKARKKDPTAGYARTFLAQMEEVLGGALDRGVRIVTNAGGLNPAGLAERLGELAERLGLAPRIAWIEGDDLSTRVEDLLAAGHDLKHLDTGRPLADAGVRPATANAYLGGWGITEALRAGADIVVCPRVTDASLVVGPAAWWHDWSPGDYDAIAGAVAAGHVIECGPQATGGNYPWPEEIVSPGYPGYPIAEVAADGSAVITKHPDTGGVVSVGTVTAQLLYEIAGPDYPNPDVVARFDTVRLSQEAPDRVLMSGTKGAAPSGLLKVALNYVGGHRNTMTLVITGLDVEAKAAAAEAMLFDILGGKEQYDEVDVRLIRSDRPDAPTNAEAQAHLRITVKSHDRDVVGRRFSNAVMELFLGGYAGFHATTPPTDATEFGVYWPALLPAETVTQTLHLADGPVAEIPHAAPPSPSTPESYSARPSAASGPSAQTRPTGPAAATVRAPLGAVAGARSGDKGGNANVGIWVRTDEEYAWLEAHLSIDEFRRLLPEADSLPVHRYELPNLRALNFVVVGLLGNGVADATRPDPQAKGLGEYVRSRLTDIPEAFVTARAAQEEPQRPGGGAPWPE